MITWPSGNAGFDSHHSVIWAWLCTPVMPYLEDGGEEIRRFKESLDRASLRTASARKKSCQFL